MILARRWFSRHRPPTASPRLLRKASSSSSSSSSSTKMPPPPPPAAPASLLAPYADPADAAENARAAELEPKAVFSLFAELARIPRPSGKEHRALEWVKAKADALGLKWQQDARGNVVVRRPAGPGCEGAPGVILQGHVDMVCEADTCASHAWDSDPIKLRVVEEKGGEDGAGQARMWLRASGTTLGADNGVGLCAALAVMALPPGTPLPPLEALVTVEEETGLFGASALDAGMLEGSVLLNLDSEQWPEVTVGCAGAGDTLIEAGGLAVEPLSSGASPPPLWLRLSVDGLSGGHSGLQIAEGRGNAVQMLASAARAVRKGVAEASSGAVAARVGFIDGGDKRNAIAREAFCTLALVPAPAASAAGGSKGEGAVTAGTLVAAREAAGAAVERLAACWREEYGSVEPGLRVSLREEEEEEGGQRQQQEGEAAAAAAAGSSSAPPPLALLRARRATLREADAERVLTLLSVLPHGPIRFSPAMPGLVETSNNTASVKLAPEEGEEGEAGEGDKQASNNNGTTVRALVQLSTRSSYPHAIDEQRERAALAARAAGATRVLPGEPYAGWAPDPKSRLARLVAQAVADVEGISASAVPIVALHAGLECGVLRERLLAARAKGGGGGGQQQQQQAAGAAAARPALEIVSFGPTILGAHSPVERVDVETTDKFWRALLKVLAELAKA